MKVKFIEAILFCCCLSACNSNENKTENQPETQAADTLVSSGTRSDSSTSIVNRPLIWTVDQENLNGEKLIKPADVRLDTFSANHLIQLINNNFPEVHLDLVKISHDTMYVNIPDSKALSENMGNTGAQNYMASATYTLTELKNVKFVNFNMKEGDHAGPGVLSRNDFKRLR